MSDQVKAARVEPRRLKGFRDYLPGTMTARWRVIDILRETARRAGFQTIATPALEYAETLLGQGSDETDKQVYRFQDHGQRDVALRFDLTVPFARYVSEHYAALVFPFKKLQIGEVWRGENTQKGRYREFTQCDLDIIGVDHVAADAEILALFAEVLGQVGGAYGGLSFTMAIGDRAVLSALLRRFFPALLDDPMGETSALIAIDKLGKIGRDGVTQLLATLPGGSPVAAGALLDLLLARDSEGHTDLQRIATLMADEPAAVQALTRLKQLIAYAKAGISESCGCRLLIDLSIARGLGYYTGVVFETTMDALPGFGSVASGGRYNNLAQRFAARELPGVGGSIGLDRLLAGIEELGLLTQTAAASVMVAVAGENARGYALRIVRLLREGGISTDIGLQAKLGGQFKHADRLGCRLVVTVGDSEEQTTTYALKDMRSGQEQRQLPLAQLVATVRAALG